MNCINHLSDDCLRLILQKFPLSESIHHRLVCSRWHSVITQIFNGKQSLKLFGSIPELRKHQLAIREHNMQGYIEFKLDNDYLIVNDPNPKFFKALTTIFPNVKRLSNTSRRLYQPVNNFKEIFHQWPSLNSLTLFGIPSPEKLPKNFWDSINSCRNLKRLLLFHLYSAIIPRHMPILGQLEHFSLVHYRGDVVPILGQLGPNCKWLILCWIYLSVDQFECLLRINPYLRSLERLTLEFISANKNREQNFENLFYLMCKNFSKLNFLDILFADHFRLHSLIPTLAQLPNLRELWIYISLDQLETAYSPKLISPYELPQLKSVRTVYLEIANISIDAFKRYIPWILPSVEHLTVKCDYDSYQCAQFKEHCLRDCTLFPCLQSSLVK